MDCIRWVLGMTHTMTYESYMDSQFMGTFGHFLFQRVWVNSKTHTLVPWFICLLMVPGFKFFLGGIIPSHNSWDLPTIRGLDLRSLRENIIFFVFINTFQCTTHTFTPSYNESWWLELEIFLGSVPRGIPQLVVSFYDSYNESY